MPFKKKAAKAAAEAPVYVAPEVVFLASVHHHFALLGGVFYDADEWGLVRDVPPHHYGAMFNAGAIPLVCNADEIMATWPDAHEEDVDDGDDDDKDEAKAPHEAKGGKFPGLTLTEKK